MKLITIFLCAAMLLVSALASPFASKRQARRGTRDILRSSNPPFKPGTTDILVVEDQAPHHYSANWAGAVLIGKDYTSVTAEFTAPTPKFPVSNYAGANNHYCSSAWTGISFCIEGTNVTYQAWYEWIPDYAHNFKDISIAAGDKIKVTVDASSKTSGTATIQNLSTGTSVNHTFTGNLGGDLCEYNAEWIVEGFTSGPFLVPFADFGTVTFTYAQAIANGTTVGPADSVLIDIKQDKILTSSSVTDNSVTVKYVSS